MKPKQRESEIKHEREREGEEDNIDMIDTVNVHAYLPYTHPRRPKIVTSIINFGILKLRAEF